MTHSSLNNTPCKKVLSGVLFALIVKIPLSQFFYTSTAIDAIDKYEVCLLLCFIPTKTALHRVRFTILMVGNQAAKICQTEMFHADFLEGLVGWHGPGSN